MSKEFCFLSRNLPTSVNFNGRGMAIDVRTKTVISCLLFLQEDKTSKDKADYVAVRLFGVPYSSLLKTGETAEKIDECIDSFLRGAPKTGNTENNKKHQTPIFDWIQDGGAIIAAFREKYGLSMQEVQSLHWWEFLALFENLSDGTYFSKIKEIRTMKIDPKHDSPERQKAIREAKRLFALEDRRSKTEKKQDFQAQLNNAFKKR